MSDKPFESQWALVEVMGRQSFPGFVSEITIAGAGMLRVDVPETTIRPAFTKYISPGSLYGITPVTEETARAAAETQHPAPFESWSIEQQVIGKLREKGLLLEKKQLPGPIAQDDEDGFDQGDDDDDFGDEETDPDDDRFGMAHETGL